MQVDLAIKDIIIIREACFASYSNVKNIYQSIHDVSDNVQNQILKNYVKSYHSVSKLIDAINEYLNWYALNEKKVDIYKVNKYKYTYKIHNNRPLLNDNKIYFIRNHKNNDDIKSVLDIPDLDTEHKLLTKTNYIALNKFVVKLSESCNNIPALFLLILDCGLKCHVNHIRKLISESVLGMHMKIVLGNAYYLINQLDVSYTSIYFDVINIIFSKDINIKFETEVSININLNDYIVLDLKSIDKRLHKIIGASSNTLIEQLKVYNKLFISYFKYFEATTHNSNRKVVGSFGSNRKKADIITINNKEHILIKIIESNEHKYKLSVMDIQNLILWPFKEMFKHIKHFNIIQEQAYKAIIANDHNILVSAPTGSGKTTIGLIAMYKLFLNNYNNVIKKLDLTKNKILYIAPFKALVYEIYKKFVAALSHLNVKVCYITSDIDAVGISINNHDLIITVPEKADVMTRNNYAHIELIKLIIIDEVHIVGTERGIYLEAIVARFMMNTDLSLIKHRIVGISATLPNHNDIATWLQVPETNNFAFDNTFRPVKLDTRLIGVKNSYATQQQFNNLICDEIEHTLNDSSQALCFTYTRKETFRVAAYIAEKFEKYPNKFIDTKKKLKIQKELYKIRNDKLKKLLIQGIGVHNAGLITQERRVVEKLYTNKLLYVVVSTSTLAWGINLPARKVIIKNYAFSNNPVSEKLLPIIDILQMLGRAGRPQYDEIGQAVLLTSDEYLKYYLDRLYLNVPLSSHIASKLELLILHEITTGIICNYSDVHSWFYYTYFSIVNKSNANLSTTILDIIESSINKLLRYKLIYIAAHMRLQTTQLGAICSKFDLDLCSINLFYTAELPTSISEIFKILFQCTVFQDNNITDVDDEIISNTARKLANYSNKDIIAELDGIYLMYYLHFVIHTNNITSEFTEFINGNNILTLSFERLLSAYIEVLKLKLCNNSWVFLTLYNMLIIFRNQIPIGKSVLYQTKKIYRKYNIEELVTSCISKHDNHSFTYITISDLREITTYELMSNLKIDSGTANQIVNSIYEIPYYELRVSIDRICNNIGKIIIRLIPLYIVRTATYNTNFNLTIYIMYDENQTECVYYDKVEINKTLPPKLSNIEFITKFQQFDEKYIGMIDDISYTIVATIPIIEKIKIEAVKIHMFSYNYYYLYFESNNIYYDYNMHNENVSIITKLQDVNPIKVDRVATPYNLLFTSFSYFNPVQSQIFHTAYHTDRNIFIGAPTGSGKTVIAELTCARVLHTSLFGKIIYIAPMKALVDQRYIEWKNIFARIGKTCVKLSSDDIVHYDELVTADIIISTPEKWDGISRKLSYMKDDLLSNIACLILDEVQFIGSDRGSVFEIIIYRMLKFNEKLRILGMSICLTNVIILCNYLSISRPAIFNFELCLRPVPCKVYLKSFSNPHFCPRLNEMNKFIASTIVDKNIEKPIIIFMSSRRQVENTALDLYNLLASQMNTIQFHNKNSIIENYQKFAYIIGVEEIKILHTMRTKPDLLVETFNELLIHKLRNDTIKISLHYGIVIHHAGLMKDDKIIAELLFKYQICKILVCTTTLAWGVNLPAYCVFIKGTEYYKNGIYKDYPSTEIMQMIGRAGRPQYDEFCEAYLCLQDCKKKFYKNFLYYGLPIDSFFLTGLCNNLCAEIAANSVITLRDAIALFVSSFFYHRFLLNRNNNNSHINCQNANIVDNDKQLAKFIIIKVHRAVQQLLDVNCIEIEKVDQNETSLTSIKLKPTNYGIILMKYYIDYQSINHMVININKSNDIIEIMKTLCNCVEFNDLPVRHDEDICNRTWNSTVLPISIDDGTACKSGNSKALALLQMHIYNLKPPFNDYYMDCNIFIKNVLRVIAAYIELAYVINNANLLNHLIILLQMITIKKVIKNYLPMIDIASKNLNVQDVYNCSPADVYIFHQDLKIRIKPSIINGDIELEILFEHYKSFSSKTTIIDRMTKQSICIHSYILQNGNIIYFNKIFKFKLKLKITNTVDAIEVYAFNIHSNSKGYIKYKYSLTENVKTY